MSATKKGSTRKKGVTPRQVNRIKTLTHKGYSTRKIQKTLSNEGIGLRRQVLLGYVREFRNRPMKANTQKYTPRKYNRPYQIRKKAWSTRAKKGSWWARTIVLQGTHDGERVQKSRSGSGKDLYEFVRDEMESRFWDRRPNVVYD